METVTVSAKYEFSEKEILLKAKDLSEKYQKALALEEERKSNASDLKSQIDDLEAQMNQLTQDIKSGHEMRDRQCTVEKNFRKKIKIFKSVETGEVVKEEILTTADAQLEIEEQAK